MKKRCVICLLLALSMLLGWLAMPVFAENAGDSCYGLDANRALDDSRKILETAQTVILYELNTDTLVYSYNADKQINPTGLVKLLTVLVALEQGNLDDVVTVYQSTLNTVAIGAVSAGLKANEEMILRDLLYCIMVSSANDACAVVAAHLAGSQADFVTLMNAKASELGCTGSHFTNPHGLMDAAQYSTARDLAIITKAALENPLFCEMFAVTGYTVKATNKSPERVLTTTNNMMRPGMANYDHRITGGKPAAATTTDRSMICTAEIGSARYLCVVTNAKGSVSEDGLVILRYGIFEEVSALLSYADAGFAVRQILDDGQTMYQYTVDNGENDVFLRPSRDVSVVLPKDCEVSELTFDQTLLSASCNAPIAVGQKMGIVTICYGNLVMGNCDLLAMTAVAPAGSTISQAERHDVVNAEEVPIWKQWISVALPIVLVLLAAAGVIYVLIRLLRNAKIRAQQRRRARNRKRSR